MVEIWVRLSHKPISFSQKSTGAGLLILGGLHIATYRITDRRKIGSRTGKNYTYIHKMLDGSCCSEIIDFVPKPEIFIKYRLRMRLSKNPFP